MIFRLCQVDSAFYLRKFFFPLFFDVSYLIRYLDEMRPSFYGSDFQSFSGFQMKNFFLKFLFIEIPGGFFLVFYLIFFLFVHLIFYFFSFKVLLLYFFRACYILTSDVFLSNLNFTKKKFFCLQANCLLFIFVL